MKNRLPVPLTVDEINMAVYALQEMASRRLEQAADPRYHAVAAERSEELDAAEEEE